MKASPDYKNVRVNFPIVEALARAKGKSIKSLSLSMGKSEYYLSNAKLKGYMPLASVIMLAFILGCTEDDLIIEEEGPKAPPPVDNTALCMERILTQMETLTTQVEQIIGILDAIRKDWNV